MSQKTTEKKNEVKEEKVEKGLFQNNFKSVKLNPDSRKSDYKLIVMEDGKEKDLGKHDGLTKCKQAAREYVMEQDKEAKEFVIYHHKPGREKDARDRLPVKQAK